MMQRRIIGDILIILTIVFTMYLSVIMTHRIKTVVLRGNYTEVFRYELIACAFFLLFALDIRFGIFTIIKPGVIKAIGWIARAFVFFVVGVFLFHIVKICAGSCIHSEAPAKSIIVLGLALENGKPTDDLLFRLDTAVKYLEENPKSIAILTGGNPDESGRTEAAVMHDILIERGIAEDRMILEDQADSTIANFQNTAMLIDPADPVVLVSSNYHMDRAVHTAKNAGFTNILRLSSPSSIIAFGSNVMSEVLLELNEMTLKKHGG